MDTHIHIHVHRHIHTQHTRIYIYIHMYVHIYIYIRVCYRRAPSQASPCLILFGRPTARGLPRRPSRGLPSRYRARGRFFAGHQAASQIRSPSQETSLTNVGSNLGLSVFGNSRQQLASQFELDRGGCLISQFHQGASRCMIEGPVACSLTSVSESPTRPLSCRKGARYGRTPPSSGLAPPGAQLRWRSSDLLTPMSSSPLAAGPHSHKQRHQTYFHHAFSCQRLQPNQTKRAENASKGLRFRRRINDKRVDQWQPCQQCLRSQSRLEFWFRLHAEQLREYRCESKAPARTRPGKGPMLR